MDCDESHFDKRTSVDKLVYIPGYDSGRQVIGQGRAYFYSVPHEACKIKELFVIPGDLVDAYEEYNKFTSVMYSNGKGDQTWGWIKSNRLKGIGSTVFRGNKH